MKLNFLAIFEFRNKSSQNFDLKFGTWQKKETTSYSANSEPKMGSAAELVT